MGGAESCMNCIHRGMGNSNSSYEYEIFQKMPFFGSVSNYLRFFNQARGMTQGSGTAMGMGMLSNITNLIPGIGQGRQGGFNPSSLIPGYNPQGGQGGFNPSSLIPDLSPQGQIFPPGPGGQQLPLDPQAIFKMLNLRNLTPIGTAKASESIFNLIGNDTFVRKVKKSSYNELVKSMEGSNQLFTDPDFPPNSQSLGDLRAHGTN